MTKENLLKDFIIGEENDDQVKYKHIKRIFKYVQHLIIKTRMMNYKSILQLK